MSFSKSLILWYQGNHRDLPWRNTTDPYKVWLSEVILQQTRVDQGLSYYHKFVDSYPQVQDLAAAEEDDVLKLWQGLGYYSRARNLLKTARIITEQYAGEFPSTYAELVKLKGIGPYTGSAIASFCFQEPVAVVDGNVYRVLSRVFGVKTAIDSTLGQKEFKSLALKLLDQNHPDIHNQAIMEFGALVCTAKTPKCQSCVFSQECYALKTKSIDKLPFKAGKTIVKKISINYLVFSTSTHILIKQRAENGIWQNLWDFPEIQSTGEIADFELQQRALEESESRKTNVISLETFGPFEHLLSHRKIKAHFLWVKVEKPFKKLLETEKWVELKEYDSYAIPRLIERFWEVAAVKIPID